MGNRRQLIIVGDTAFAEIAFEYFTTDTDYEVVAFSVERNYLKQDSLFGLPVVAFEELETLYKPRDHRFFVAATYSQLNALRRRLYSQTKQKGFLPASYTSPHAFVWKNCKIGEHCFVFENNVIQPFVRLGRDVILWSGNHIGHHSVIGNHCFISSHVVVSGFVDIGEGCFLGVNSTISNNVSIGANCLIGAGALVLGDVPDGQKVVGIWKKGQNRA